MNSTPVATARSWVADGVLVRSASCYFVCPAWLLSVKGVVQEESEPHAGLVYNKVPQVKKLAGIE